ncbi:Uma2 family endonuclease [Streptomyces sp. NPDC051569]|uniref:Uma2 family endonuclease n=1 Tax=Streptomyces sp. NPDC051569 TaxID=3365661 RepID=UPI00378D6786
MTVMAERTVQMSVEEFERIAELVERESDAVRLEFIHGRIGIRGMTDGDHSEIIRWLQKRCMRVRADLWLYAGGELGLQVEAYRKGRAKPDAVLAPERTFVGQGDWADPEGVLMTVEVTSYDSDTDRRDREEKPAAYAAAGIPLYLLIDRDHGTVTVHSDPAVDGYRYRQVADFGTKILLPDPVGIELDTEDLKEFVR